MKQRLAVGKHRAIEALLSFCKGKRHIALVTGGTAYGLCGAKNFLEDFLAAHSEIKVTHLVVPGANPKIEGIEALLGQIAGELNGFIAVGGGTVIDTAKLLNLSVVSQKGGANCCP